MSTPPTTDTAPVEDLPVPEVTLLPYLHFFFSMHAYVPMVGNQGEESGDCGIGASESFDEAIYRERVGGS